MSTIGDITAVGNVAKFAVAFPLTYHYLGGVRHFMWDKNPEMLENDKVEQSSKLLFAGSVALSAVAAVL
jgi:succinate dehydrogenase (ubiquinone) cytochrome b560 subunit